MAFLAIPTGCQILRTEHRFQTGSRKSFPKVGPAALRLAPPAKQRAEASISPYA